MLAGDDEGIECRGGKESGGTDGHIGRSSGSARVLADAQKMLEDVQALWVRQGFPV